MAFSSAVHILFMYKGLQTVRILALKITSFTPREFPTINWHSQLMEDSLTGLRQTQGKEMKPDKSDSAVVMAKGSSRRGAVARARVRRESPSHLLFPSPNHDKSSPDDLSSDSPSIWAFLAQGDTHKPVAKAPGTREWHEQTTGGARFAGSASAVRPLPPPPRGRDSLKTIH